MSPDEDDDDLLHRRKDPESRALTKSGEQNTDELSEDKGFRDLTTDSYSSSTTAPDPPAVRIRRDMAAATADADPVRR
jgi:hypothetical protein